MDYKTAYHEVSELYVTVTATQSEIDKMRYQRAKRREAIHGSNWEKNKVNINEIVDKFIPDKENIKTYSESGYKFIFEGAQYIVKCDKVGGYLRIYDKKSSEYCLIDGTPSEDQSKTHFKIKKREEM